MLINTGVKGLERVAPSGVSRRRKARTAGAPSLPTLIDTVVGKERVGGFTRVARDGATLRFCGGGGAPRVVIAAPRLLDCATISAALGRGPRSRFRAHAGLRGVVRRRF